MVKVDDAEARIMLRRVEHGQPIVQAGEEDGLLKAMYLEQDDLIGPLKFPFGPSGHGDVTTTLTDKGRAFLKERTVG